MQDVEHVIFYPKYGPYLPDPKNPSLVMVRSISEEDEQLKEKLRVIAFEQRIDVSDIVRDSLWRYVREYESARKGPGKTEGITGTKR